MSSNFKETTKWYVKETGQNVLIPVLSQADSVFVEILNIARKTLVRSKLFWHKEKYIPENIRLLDILTPGEDFADLTQESNNIGTLKLKGFRSRSGEFHIGKPNIFQSQFGLLTILTYDIDLCTNADLIREETLQNALSTRQIDLNHPAVKEIRKNEETICVITSVYELVSPTTISITQYGNLSAGINSQMPQDVTAGVNVAFSSHLKAALSLPERTRLAYKVSQLKIDETGKFELGLTRNAKGGFVTQIDSANSGITMPTTAEDQKMDLLKKARDVMAPFFKCSKEYKEEIRRMVYNLRENPTDIMMVIKIFDNDDCGEKAVENFITKIYQKTDCQSLRNPLIFILEALSEMTDEQFEWIKSLQSDIAEALLHLCKEFLKAERKNVVIIKENEKIYKSENAKKLAETMGFVFLGEGTLATLTLTEEEKIPFPSFENVFWVLFAFYQS